MERTDQAYVLGEWEVKAGSEEEFVQRWNAFIEWTLDNAPGAGSFVLIRSTEDPTEFTSLGSWESQEARQAWREMPRHQELLDQCLELCEEFDSEPYTLAASHGKGPLGGVTDTVGGVTEPVSGVTDTVGGTTSSVTDTVGGATDSVRGATDNLLGGQEKQR